MAVPTKAEEPKANEDSVEAAVGVKASGGQQAIAATGGDALSGAEQIITDPKAQLDMTELVAKELQDMAEQQTTSVELQATLDSNDSEPQAVQVLQECLAAVPGESSATEEALGVDRDIDSPSPITQEAAVEIFQSLNIGLMVHLPQGKLCTQYSLVTASITGSCVWPLYQYTVLAPKGLG